MKKQPRELNLTDLVDRHRFGGIRLEPVMTAQAVRVDSGIDLQMIWTCRVMEQDEKTKRWKEVALLAVGHEDGLPKLLRDIASLMEEGLVKVHA